MPVVGEAVEQRLVRAFRHVDVKLRQVFQPRVRIFRQALAFDVGDLFFQVLGKWA